MCIYIYIYIYNTTTTTNNNNENNNNNVYPVTFTRVCTPQVQARKRASRII